LVLPSYREGMSRTLLEGAAMGRPLIASDVPGCREAIDAGANGWLCQARQVSSLVDAMMAACRTPPAQLQQMGHTSRRKAELEFSETAVTAAYLEAIAALDKGASRAA
jgi:glycosyltransferase involved in cell wall biosynthesis